MKHNTLNPKIFSLAALTFGLCLAPTLVLAGPQVFDPSVSTCTGANCSSVAYNGSYIRDQNGNANPFILQVFSAGNECMRLDVVSQGTDLETVLISPNGSMWRNDDRGGGDLRPLVKAITNVRGWYTLQISHFAGTASGVFDFDLRYGRYPSNNPNCSGATVPLAITATGELLEEEIGKSLEGGAAGRTGRGPSSAADGAR